ncbi:MAG: hypothetical protein CMF72_15670 [Mameliella sp.]|nr:hypothetical protein [Mameliella sp.]|tara:strand:+ start:2361 stop:2645 length:285 start_codon:yes stop_codon:yes gene_type:complete
MSNPQPLGDETTHYWRVQRMAKVTGVDLVRAVNEGLLSQADWAGLVSCCRGCSWAEGCGHWLDSPGADTRALPSPCVNRKRLAALMAAMQDTAP